MTFTAVLLFLHDSEPITIRDTFDADGRFIDIGAQAASAIARREAVHYVTAEGTERIIPFHAIVGVNVDKGEEEYTKPEDDFCKAMECPTTPMCDEEEAGNEGEDEGEGQ